MTSVIGEDLDRQTMYIWFTVGHIWDIVDVFTRENCLPNLVASLMKH